MPLRSSSSLKYFRALEAFSLARSSILPLLPRLGRFDSGLASSSGFPPPAIPGLPAEATPADAWPRVDALSDLGTPAMAGIPSLTCTRRIKRLIFSAHNALAVVRSVKRLPAAASVTGRCRPPATGSTRPGKNPKVSSFEFVSHGAGGLPMRFREVEGEPVRPTFGFGPSCCDASACGLESLGFGATPACPHE